MKRHIAIAAVLLLGLVVSSVAETVRLKDGSTLKGHVVSITSDSLYVKTSFGARVAIARSAVAAILFVDDGGFSPGAAAPAKAEPAGEGRLAVVFSDRSLSSKIRIRRKDDEKELLKANWLVESLFVDGNQVFSYVDSLMDKTIYNGPERVYKNTIEAADFDVPLPAGTYNCIVVVESRGRDEFKDRFEGEPLHMSIAFDNVRIDPGRTTRHRIGIKKGKFRMGKPKFVDEGH